MVQTKNQRFSFRCCETDKKLIKDLAEHMERTQSDMVRTILRQVWTEIVIPADSENKGGVDEKKYSEVEK